MIAEKLMKIPCLESNGVDALRHSIVFGRWCSLSLLVELHQAVYYGDALQRALRWSNTCSGAHKVSPQS